MLSSSTLKDLSMPDMHYLIQPLAATISFILLKMSLSKCPFKILPHCKKGRSERVCFSCQWLILFCSRLFSPFFQGLCTFHWNHGIVFGVIHVRVYLCSSSNMPTQNSLTKLASMLNYESRPNADSLTHYNYKYILYYYLYNGLD